MKGKRRKEIGSGERKRIFIKMVELARFIKARRKNTSMSLIVDVKKALLV